MNPISEISSISDIRVDCLEKLSNPYIYRIPTGYYKLDCILDYFMPGSLITIGGLTGMGKSAFALNLLRNISIDYKIPSLLFSAEMNNVSIINRLISMHCGIPHSLIHSGMMTDDAWKRLEEKIDDLDAPLYIENTHNLYIEDVERVARDAVEREGVKMIVVDYLQMMYYKVRMNDNRYVEINSIICRLKSLAIELQVPIIVISLLNRNIEDRHFYNDKTPQLSDLRDSGTIGDDSDIVMFIHRPECLYIYQDDNGNDMRGVAKIIIAKNRFGYTGTVLLNFHSECLLFVDPEKDINSQDREQNNKSIFNTSEGAPF